MSLSFGARLRAQRERRQVTLATIAEHTKIKASLLEGLERDDLSHWPGGIFRRSYVRAYAHAIGLDPEAVVQEFLDRYPDPAEETAEAIARARHALVAAQGPSTRLGFLISSAIDALPDLRTPSAARNRPQPAPVARLEHPPAPEPGDEVSVEQGPAGDSFVLPLDPVPDAPSSPPAAVPIDAAGLARVCTRLACAADAADVTDALAEAAVLLDAVGLMLWTWDRDTGVLRPVIGHGYPGDLLGRLPPVRPDADNAIAWTFRSADVRDIPGSDAETAALTVPLMTAAGCAGVLAFELRDGDERRPWTRAGAAILAAQLATLVGQPSLARAATA